MKLRYVCEIPCPPAPVILSLRVKFKAEDRQTYKNNMPKPSDMGTQNLYYNVTIFFQSAKWHFGNITTKRTLSKTE